MRGIGQLGPNGQPDFSRLYSIESEQAVIGAILLDNDALDGLGGLRPEHCWADSHRLILAMILSMAEQNKPIDVITLAEELHDAGKADETGGLSYLGELQTNTPSARSIARYAETVRAKAIERQLFAAADKIHCLVESPGNTAEKLASAQHEVMSITELAAARAPRSMREVLIGASEVLATRSSGGLRGVSTGFLDLDKKLGGGLCPGHLVIVAGRPSMGKTSLAVNIGYRVASARKNVLMLSLEMPEQELADRLIAQAGDVNLASVLAGKLDGETGHQIMRAVRELNDLPLWIDDQAGVCLFDVVAKARSMRRKNGLSLLVVDYLQLMSGEGDSRNSQLEQITRGLKGLAKELEIPVVVLSQLSRECDKRPNKRPQMSDLRDSGAIEQDADVIMFVYRDEVYHKDSPDKGTAEILIDKQRQGETGMVRLGYQGGMTRFVDLAPDWEPAATEDKPMSGRRRRRGADD